MNAAAASARSLAAYAVARILLRNELSDGSLGKSTQVPSMSNFQP